MSTPTTITHHNPPILPELFPKAGDSPSPATTTPLSGGRISMSPHTPTNPPESLPSEASAYATPVIRRMVTVYEEESPPKEEVDPFHPSIPSTEEFIVRGKNYGTPAAISTRLNLFKRGIQTLTPMVGKHQTPTSADAAEDVFESELGAIYENLFQFMNIPDADVLCLTSEERSNLGLLIQYFMTNLTLTGVSEIYEELYVELEQRLSEPAFENFFPPVKV